MGSAPAGAQTNFGPVNIGAGATLTVTLTTPAAATLGSIAVVSQGSTALDFTNGGAGTCTPANSYAAGQPCTVQVTFKPAYAGERYGEVLLMDGSGNRIAAALLEGNGVGPQIAFGPGASIAIAPMVNEIPLIQPFDVAVDGNGDVFIADSLNARAVELSAGGAPVAIDPAVAGEGLVHPGGVAVNGAGDLFIADLDRNVVMEVPANGGTATIINPIVNGIGLHYPCGMVIDGAGNLFIADVDNGRVVEVPAGGGAAFAIDPLVNGEKLSYPVTLAMDSAGDLFIADMLANRVVEVPAGGGAATAIDPSVNGQSLSFPYGIAVDGAGDLFIADANNRVVEAPVNGGTPTAIAPAANGVGLNDPIGIGLDAAGDLFIADSLNNRVVEVQRSQPPAINFAATLAGSVSSDSPKAVQVENIGNAPLTFPVPAAGNNPGISANFTLDSSGSSACPFLTPGASQPGTLASGATCLLPISFRPASGGAIYGTLTLTDNSLNPPAPGYATQSISLSGNAPVTSVSATSLSFGPQLVETASAPQKVTLTNTGSAALMIASIVVTGVSASSFLFPNSCGSALAAGASCVLQGHFTPAGASAMTAALTITDNAGGSPQSIGLTGIGVYPATVTVTPSAFSINTSQSLTVLVAVGGASGEPAPAGSVAVTIGGFSSTPVLLTGGSTTIDVPANSLAAGTDSIVATYQPDSASASTYASASGDSSVTVSPSSTATAPAAATGAASAITSSSAALAASVNPDGADTQTWFLYGASSTLGGASQTPSQDLGSTAAADPVSAGISGLSASTTYYYQAIAQNTFGTTSGAIHSFTTTPAPYFSVLTGAPLSIVPGATTGNTATISVTPWYGFTGTVSLSCAISPATASDLPTCSVPASVTINGDTAQSATLTVNTTASTSLNKRPNLFWPSAAGTVLACILLFGIPARRTSRLTTAGWLVLFAAIAGICCGGCGGGGSGGSGPLPTPGTTAGSYTVTVTGISGSMTETGTVAVTVQ